MPTYDYRCDACGHELEVFQSITAAPKRKCPACGKRKLQRVIGSGAGIIFKGSGFYETDYRSDSYKKGAETEKQAVEEIKPKKDASDTKASKDTKGADTKGADTKKSE